MCLKITRGLVAAKVPVVTEFSYFKVPGEEWVAMVLYTGRAPSYRLTVTQEMLHQGQDPVLISIMTQVFSSAQVVWVRCWPVTAPR